MKFTLTILGLALSLSSFATHTLSDRTSAKTLAIADAEYKKLPIGHTSIPCYGPSGDSETCLEPIYGDLKGVEVTVEYDDSSNSDSGRSTYTEILEPSFFSAEELACLSSKNGSVRRKAGAKALTFSTRKEVVESVQTYCQYESDSMCTKPSDYVTDRAMVKVLAIDIVRK